MGSVNILSKPESDSIKYSFVEDQSGKLSKVSFETLRNLLNYISADDNGEIVSWMEPIDGGIKVSMKDGSSFALPISQAKEFETVEYNAETHYLHFYDANGDDVYDPVYIEGGGGGGDAASSSSVVRLTNQNGTSTITVPLDKAVNLMFDFTSTEDEIPTGDGTCQILVNGAIKATFGVKQGFNTVNVSPYLTAGSNNVRVKCSDVYGVYKTLAYTVSVVDMYITSTFDASVPYSGDITFKYTPYGAVEKNIHILVDGTEKASITTATSGKQQTYIIYALPHGTHTIDVYAIADINGTLIESKHLVFDIICREAENTTPMISSVYDITTIEQGSLISIPYIVYDPAKLACDISLDIYTLSSGSEIMYLSQTITVDRTQQYWNARRYPTGDVHFRIKYGDIFKEHVLTVTESSIQLEPEENDLELSLISEGRSNNESTPGKWVYGDYTTTFTGFNWKTNGWVFDEDGDTCLRLNNHARAEISFQPFKDDIRTNGKTIEIEFAIRDANNRDDVILGCMADGIGFEIKADTAYVSSEQSTVFCKYREEDKVKVAFVVESRNEYRMLSVYLNGVLSDVVQYPETDNFQQSNPVNISIGCDTCGIDLYTIRSYNTALNQTNSVNNYIADIDDVVAKTEAYERNDIYDEYGNISFEKCKTKNSIMVIIGDLPQSKGDKKNVQIQYYDIDDGSVSYLDEMTVADVQGTSSQFFVRKNFKLKTAAAHYIDKQHLPVKVICIKVDYAEATGTHNTQNANFVETLYSEKFPAQLKEPKCRSTIYGKPILLFHKKDAYSDPVFYGKANYNYDKGAEDVFGFTSEYDVECWEFKNNTSDACNFLAPITTKWTEDFESRYPEANTNLGRFNTMHSWVVSTRQDTATGAPLPEPYTDGDGVVYKLDTDAYRLAKFKTEFETHFDMHYALIYYVYTFFALMVDQRAKNMFLTYWGETDKWQPWFYDNDTCFGINNEGQLVFDYYHEDTDQLDGANVYNGQNSVLWNNFRQAFPDKIKETYQNLRNSGLITYDKLISYFITNGSDKWSESIYNEDSDFKYISMLRERNDATNLSQVRGTGEEHFRYIIENRLNYCDSKWYASDYANDYISLRIYTPTEWTGVQPDPTITVIPFSDMYAGVRYKANGTLYQKRVKHGESVTFTPAGETFDPENSESFNDTETAIYGAHQLSSIGDLAPLYCGSVNVSNADKIIELKVGDATEGYSNANLKELSVGTNRRLKKIDVRNCPNFASALDLSGCPGIEEVYATGTAITGVEFPESGVLKIAHLPATIANFTIKHQQYIESVTFEGYDNIKTLWVEKTPNVDAFDILSKAPNINRLRITDVDLRFDNASELVALAARPIGGIDENGINTDVMWIDGKCHIEELTGAEYANVKSLFPHLDITYGALVTQLVFMNDDGTSEISRQTIRNGGDGSYSGSTPTKSSTAQYDFTFAGWSLTKGGNPDDNALKQVEADRIVYAAYNKKIRSYTVRFYNGSTLLQTSTVEYGSNATYTGETPTNTSSGNASDFKFIGWNPSPDNITGNTNCYAQFYDMREISDSWDDIIKNTKARNSAYERYAVGSYKPMIIGNTETIPCDVTYKSGVTVYNNLLYLFEGNGSDKTYTYDGAEWVEGPTLPNTIDICCACVYNNELHLISRLYHYKLSGTSWAEVTDVPFKKYVSTDESMFAVSYNNEIHLMFKNNANTILYIWNGSEWTYKTGISSTVIFSMFVYNDQIIVNSSSNIYAYTHGSTSFDIVRNGDSDEKMRGQIILFDNDIHLFGGINKPSNHQTIGIDYNADEDSYTCTFTDLEPIMNNTAGVTYSFRSVIYNNQIHVLGGNNTNRQHLIYSDEWSLVGCEQIVNMQIAGKEMDEQPIGDLRWIPHLSEVPIEGDISDTGNIIELNNELHIISLNQHVVFDGCEWQTLPNLPFIANGCGAVVYNGEIHLLGGIINGTYQTTHYKWDGSEWISVSTLPAYYHNAIPAVYDNKIHIDQISTEWRISRHYAWDGSEWSEPTSTSMTDKVYNLVSFNGLLYMFLDPDDENIFSANHYMTWDGTDYTRHSLTNGIYVRNAFVYDNSICLVHSQSPMYECTCYRLDGDTVTEIATVPTDGQYEARLITSYANQLTYFYGNNRYTLSRYELEELCSGVEAEVNRQGVAIWKGDIYKCCDTTLKKYNGSTWEEIDGAPHGTALFALPNVLLMYNRYAATVYEYDGSTFTKKYEIDADNVAIGGDAGYIFTFFNDAVYIPYSKYIFKVNSLGVAAAIPTEVSVDDFYIVNDNLNILSPATENRELSLYVVSEANELIRNSNAFTNTYEDKPLTYVRYAGGSIYAGFKPDDDSPIEWVRYDSPESEPVYVGTFGNTYWYMTLHNTWPLIVGYTDYTNTDKLCIVHGHKVGLTFIAKELYHKPVVYYENTHNGRYPDSAIRRKVCRNQIFNTIPNSIRESIKSINKYWYDTYDFYIKSIPNETIWLPATIEMGDDYNNGTALIDTYPIFTDNESRKRVVPSNLKNDIYAYALRDNTGLYAHISVGTDSGLFIRITEARSEGLLICFCI